jgi:hypothetical protein
MSAEISATISEPCPKCDRTYLTRVTNRSQFFLGERLPLPPLVFCGACKWEEVKNSHGCAR